MIKVVIADDDPIIREGLKMIIESQTDIELTGIAANGNEAVKICRELSPNVALLDIRMPEKDGIEAAECMLREKLCSPLLLTTFDEEELVLRALNVGASGYILKNSPAERILNAIRTVSTGGTVFQADILDYIRTKVSRSHGDTGVFKLLSQREVEIVELISEGLSNQEIASRLFISHGTVRNHISTILEKTGFEHRTKIAVRYLTNRQ